MKNIVSILQAKLKSIGVDVNEILKQLSATDISVINDEDLALKFVSQAKIIIQNQKEPQELIFIIDQINDLPSGKVTTFLKDLKNTYKCLLAGSANNNPKDFAVNFKHVRPDEELVRFGEKNFRALCTFFDVSFTKIEREEILSITGSIAMYLNDFLTSNYSLIKLDLVPKSSKSISDNALY